MKNHYKFWIIFSLIITFAAGIAGGIFIDKLFIKEKIERPRRGPAPSPSREIEILTQELNLTTEQQEKIREIFKNNEESFRSLRKDFFERLSTMRTQLRNEINSVLTEEQRKKFEAMIEKFESQMRKEQEKRKHSKRFEREKNKGEER